MKKFHFSLTKSLKGLFQQMLVDNLLELGF